MSPAANVDEYIATAPEETRATLEELRKMIGAAAPGAVEAIGYGIPGYKYKGRPLAYFGAAKNHCALYGLPTVMEAHQDELAAYDTSKGTIRFPVGQPPPAPLVAKLVKARIAEIEAAAEAKGRRRR